MEIRKKTRRGSILVFTLLILFIMIAGSLSIASVSVTSLKSSDTNDKTTQAFQSADSAIEIVIKNIEDNDIYADLHALANNLGSDWQCSHGKITGNIASLKSENSIEVSFKDSDGDSLGDCDASNPAFMKVVATSKGTTRAIEVSLNSGSSTPPCSDTCSSLGYTCGTYSICGTSTNCGSCETCSDTCSSLGYTCGTYSICGTSTNCGSCETCSDTCSSLGYTCGTHSICGTSTNCGSCGTSQTCNASGVCVVNCDPRKGEECSEPFSCPSSCWLCGGCTGGGAWPWCESFCAPPSAKYYQCDGSCS